MTVFYNSTLYAAYRETNKKIREEHKNIPKQDIKFINDIINLSYNYLNKISIKNDYNIESLNHLNYETNECDIKYYNSYELEERIKFTKIRKTHTYITKHKTLKELSNEDVDMSLLRIDKKKTLTAMPANIVHHLDSKIVNEILKEDVDLYTIHDMFMINGVDKDILFDKINNHYNKKLNNNNYSLTILI
jgi:hypothetical protein